MKKKDQKLDINNIAKEIKKSKIVINNQQKRLQKLSAEFIKLLGSDKTFEFENITITTREDIAFTTVDLNKLVSELSAVMNFELVSKIINKSKVKKNRSGGLTIRFRKDNA